MAAGAYIKDRMTKKNAPPVDNVGAYFRRTLAGGWGAVQPAPGGKAAATATAGGTGTAAAAVLSPKDLRERYIAHRIPLAKGYFNELAVEDQTRLIDDYNDSVSLKQLKISKSRKSSTIAEKSFFTWLAHTTWGEPSDSDLLQYLLSGAGDTAAN